jgi:hypothetical protein
MKHIIFVDNAVTDEDMNTYLILLILVSMQLWEEG